MEQIYNNKMQAVGYNQHVCDIFLDWENVKDELLVPERKTGSGNGTIHIFLGAADEELRKEFPQSYASVKNETDAADNAIEIKHYFLYSNIISVLGYMCQYNYEHNHDVTQHVEEIFRSLAQSTRINGLLTTKSLFKLSTGSSKLRPYFKQFESDGVFVRIVRKILLPNSAYKISLYKNSNNEYAAFWLIGFDDTSDFEVDADARHFVHPTNASRPFQQIFYGAPGTGKSHAVKVETEEWEKRGRVVRTTFHPDSDYSTFVGVYKPTTESVQRYDIYNKPMTRDGVPVMEQIITYEFVEQAFLQAYIDAWKNREEPEFLVIEEVNRGNCAQIFGDLFQLLDRGDDGYSEYAIRADKDLQKHLCKAFEDVDMADYPNVKTGKELLLPANLYIRATMNTSDQSLFPIDSAFKRRWDWKYVPIAKGSDNGSDLNWMVEVDGDLYDWWTFVKTINKHVFDTTNSEDKQLGFFFCKAKDNVISAETFVCKVIFYLWNDVFKDFGFDDSIFEDKEDSVNPKLSFEKFYLANGKVNEGKVIMFLKNLGMMPMEDNNRVDSIDSKTLFKINGKSTNKLNAIPYMAIAEYVRLHPDKTAQEVVDIWEPFKKYSQKSWIVCNKQDFDTDPTKYANYSQEIPCADGQSLWVNKDGWMHNPAKQRDTIAEFIKAVNEAGFGIRITEDAI